MDKPNGAAGEQTPAQGSGLLDVMNAHAQALVKARTRADGKAMIDPMQLVVDAELLSVKVALLFEVMVELGGMDSATLVVRLRDKLIAETQQIESEALRQRLAFASGHVPRRG